MNSIWRLLTSFGLACVLLSYLCALTFFGTLYQESFGLYEAQRRFFDSWFVAFPMPGGQLVLVVLATNLVLGGIVNLRKSFSRLGILVTHLGMVLLLVAGWVKYYQAVEGSARLYEGQETDRFESFHDWEVALLERLPDGRVKEHLIAHEQIAQRPEDRTTIRSDELPFTVELSGFLPHCEPQPAARAPRGARVVDGFWLAPQAFEKEAGARIAGVYAALRESDRAVHEGILWGFGPRDGRPVPWTVEAGGRKWQVVLRHRSWQLPFTVHLKRAVRVDHPGTTSPKAFYSDVVRSQGDVLTASRIQMNEPLRHLGYTLYQHQMGTDPERGPWSGFQVSYNPSDQWPKYACYVIALGMLLHFGMKLSRHVRGESLRRLHGGVA
jgi:hypothetical protein